MGDRRRFLVTALDSGQSLPVLVRCSLCGVQGTPCGGPGRTAVLQELADWAAAHECGPALSPGAWARAAAALRQELGPRCAAFTADETVAALAAALLAVWGELRECAAGTELQPGPG